MINKSARGKYVSVVSSVSSLFPDNGSERQKDDSADTPDETDTQDTDDTTDKKDRTDSSFKRDRSRRQQF